MLRGMFAVLAVLVLVVPVAAQQVQQPDYSIRNIRSRVSDDNAQVSIEFEVYNVGGTASREATARLTVLNTGEPVAATVFLVENNQPIPIDELRPLRAAEIVTLRLTFPATLFPADSVQSFQVAIGIDEVEDAVSQTAQNNFARIDIAIPRTLGGGATPVLPQPTPTPARPADITQWRRNLETALSDPLLVAALAIIVLIVSIPLWLLLVILRLLFQRTPSFGTWQPPYADMPLLDPNSLAGRRQAWQQHAQNNSLPVPCVDGNVYARKVLMGVDGGNLAGWRVIAMRISQYDAYGRVARSQVLASKGLVKRLDRAVRKSHALDREGASRRVEPVAKGLVKAFAKKLNRRNAMLPVALDIRFQGTHGEVRILFELYQCQYKQWRKIDQWEPEMTVLGKTIYESYTYTVHGQHPNETLRTYTQRLQHDLMWLLTEMITTSMAEDSRPLAQDVVPTLE